MQHRPPLLRANPGRRSEQRQLPGLRQRGLLGGRGRLRRAHTLPHRVGVAVLLVDAVVLKQRLASGQALQV